MATTSVKDVAEGSTITFRSKNVNDPTVYLGVLESVGTYRSIRDRLNPTAYNEAVRQSDPTVSSDITALTYFLITLSNNQTEETMDVFADEWIAAGSLSVLTLANKVTVVVEDPNQNPQAIVSLLANAGYACTISS